MRRAALMFIGILFLGAGALLSARAQQPQPATATLFSVNKHQGEQLKYCINLKRAVNGVPCDIAYGMLYAGDELDWFQSVNAPDSRSMIKDLGAKDWSTSFEVPVVEPLAKLKPGEQRHITIDTSGADGADGADADGVVRPKSSRPKRDGIPKIDPAFVKAVVGHVYVIHVVDDSRDFYALFRVDDLQRGDYCTVSWKLIQNPVNQTSASR